METVVMMYVLPMLLGQTYDNGRNQPGIQIFSASVLNESTVIEHYQTDSQYRVVENANEVRDFLNIDGKLSLKIKSGMLDASGEGSYLKDGSSKSNGVELLVKVHFETVTETIHSTAEPEAGWSLRDVRFLGTHFCRSVTYGGDLLASVKISSSNVYDMEKIKGIITSGIQTGKAFDADIQARLDKLKSDAVDSSSLEINYYASVPIRGVSYTIESLLELIRDFPGHVKQINRGRGNPLRMELHALSSLKEGFPQYLENRALTDQLEDLEEQFDDLRSTRRELGIWFSQLPPVIPDKVNSMIRNFSKQIDDIFGIFSKSIGDMDLSLGASTKSFEEAAEAYEAGENSIPQKFTRKFKALQKETYKEAPELKPKVGGATYIRWGRQKCESSTDTETATSGVAVAVRVSPDGGYSDFKCSPLQPDLLDPADDMAYKIDKQLDENEEDIDGKFSIVSLHYIGSLKQYENLRNQTISCAICRARDRTSAILKVASKSCPAGWTSEYEGMLMAPGPDGSKGEYVCVDVDLQVLPGDLTFGDGVEEQPLDLQEVGVKCGSLPCDRYPEGSAIPCVVCTI